MSAYPSVDVRCDWPGCYSRIRTHFPKVTDARQWAKKYGWVRAGGVVDLCGPGEAGKAYDSDLTRWNNHAARTDHTPVVKPSRKGYAKLSCSCGWDYVAPYSWQPEGACSRSMVEHYWGEHVREAEAAVKATTQT